MISTTDQIQKRRKYLTHVVTWSPKDRGYYWGFHTRMLQQKQAGQIIGINTELSVKTREILDAVLDLARPLYNLRQICRVIPSDEFGPEQKVDLASQLRGTEKVKPFQEVEIPTQNVTSVAFDNPSKNVVTSLVLSDETRLMNNIDVFKVQEPDAAAELARMENKQIAEVAETATAIAGNDWTNTANDPYVDLEAAMNAIEPPGATEPKPAIDFIAANPRVWLGFFRNPKVKTTLDPLEILSAKRFLVPGFTDVFGYSDRALTSTVALVGSTKAPVLVHFEGPTENARYENIAAGYEAYIIRSYIQPILVTSSAIRKLTGVHG